MKGRSEARLVKSRRRERDNLRDEQGGRIHPPHGRGLNKGLFFTSSRVYSGSEGARAESIIEFFTSGFFFLFL